MKFKHSREFTIGLSVIAALVIVYFGIEYLKGNNVFTPANYYYATYTDVAGLQQSAPVTVNGYKVGQVREIEYQYDNPGHVKVEISLDKELRLPKGTKAMIVSDMLGTASISLQMASGTDYYATGSEIPGANAPGLMGKVTDDILPAVGQIVPKIDSLITSLNTLVSSPALASSIDHLNTALANIEAGTVKLNQVMNKMPGIAGDAQVMMTNFKGMSESLNTIAGDLTEVSAQIKEMPLQATVDNLAKTAESLHQLMQQLNSADSSLGLLLHDTGLYDNLNNASASLDSLLRDVKKNPKRYISIKLL